MHLSLQLQKQVLGASSGGIPPRLIQVNSLAHLFHFHVKNLNFHGQIKGHPNLGVLAHAEINHFSLYRAFHTQKYPPKPVYIRICSKTVTYRAARKVLWANNNQNLFFFCRMVLEWREREHGDVEEVVQANLMDQ